jgi:hypothetical protein
MGRIKSRARLLGAVCIVAAIVAGGALPVLLGAGGAASSLGLKRAPVAACSPPSGEGAAEPVAQASPPCTPKLVAKPATGLRDGQTIKVTGSGFAPNELVEFLECQSDVTSNENACAFNIAGAAETDSTGVFKGSFQVRRLIEPESTVIDCATRGACVLAALDEDGNGIATTTPITFKKVPLPSLTVTPATGLADGQTLTVKGAHFDGGSQPVLTECPVGPSEFFNCDSDIAQTVTVGPDGTFTATFDVARILSTDQEFGSGTGIVDCAQAPGCDLDAIGEYYDAAEATAPLSFDPSVPPLPPLNVSLIVNSTGVVNANGGAVLTGTISCTATTPVDVTIQATLDETSLGLSANSTIAASQSCGQTPAPVSLTLPDQTVPFSAGIGEVTLNLMARQGSSVAQQLVSGAISLSVAAHQPAPVYYLALGDTLAFDEYVPAGQGYVADLQADLEATVPGLQLVNLSCSGETSTSMITENFCSYPAGSQLAQAVAFLSAHQASVAVVTMDIGGGDYLPCLIDNPPGVNLQCISTTNAATTANVTSIVSQLKTAAGPSIPIVGMNYFDPFLAYWTGGALGRSIAKESVIVIGEVNGAISAGYATKSIPVADVSGAFQTTDLSQKVKTSFGLVPVAVANVCQWLDFTCAKNEPGFAEDTNPAGALVVAGAFEKLIPANLSAGPKALESKARILKARGATAGG